MNWALLDRARELGAQEDGLAVVATNRADGSSQVSVVNAGVLDHPVTGQPVVGFVARGGARKLANLRARPRASVVFRSGWEWIGIEGEVDLAGPDDELEGLPSGQVLGLLCKVYAAAVGGAPGEWAAMGEVFYAERHAAVLIHPDRVYSNPNG